VPHDHHIQITGIHVCQAAIAHRVAVRPGTMHDLMLRRHQPMHHRLALGSQVSDGGRHIDPGHHPHPPGAAFSRDLTLAQRNLSGRPTSEAGTGLSELGTAGHLDWATVHVLVMAVSAFYEADARCGQTGKHADRAGRTGSRLGHALPKHAAPPGGVHWQVLVRRSRTAWFGCHADEQICRSVLYLSVSKALRLRRHAQGGGHGPCLHQP
jgi:hypothetical protein